MKTILALDVSVSATGWAYGAPGEVPLSGVIRFAPKGATEDEVWYAALRWMTEQMGVLNPDVVAIEAPIMSVGGFTSAQTQGALWGLQAVLRTVAKAKGRPARLVNVSSARLLFTGKGRYEKDQAKPAVKRRCVELGWVDQTATYDRCDALCVFAKAAADIDPAFAEQFTPLGAKKSNVVHLVPPYEAEF